MPPQDQAAQPICQRRSAHAGAPPTRSSKRRTPFIPSRTTRCKGGHPNRSSDPATGHGRGGSAFQSTWGSTPFTPRAPSASSFTPSRTLAMFTRCSLQPAGDNSLLLVGHRLDGVVETGPDRDPSGTGRRSRDGRVRRRRWVMVYRQIDETSPSRPITLHSKSRSGSNPVTMHVVDHAPIASCTLCPTKRASSAGPISPRRSTRRRSPPLRAARSKSDVRRPGPHHGGWRIDIDGHRPRSGARRTSSNPRGSTQGAQSER